jgi:hypothetical protein
VLDPSTTLISQAVMVSVVRLTVNDPLAVAPDPDPDGGSMSYTNVSASAGAAKTETPSINAAVVAIERFIPQVIRLNESMTKVLWDRGVPQNRSSLIQSSTERRFMCQAEKIRARIQKRSALRAAKALRS